MSLKSAVPPLELNLLRNEKKSLIYNLLFIVFSSFISFLAAIKSKTSDFVCNISQDTEGTMQQLVAWVSMYVHVCFVLPSLTMCVRVSLCHCIFPPLSRGEPKYSHFISPESSWSLFQEASNLGSSVNKMMLEEQECVRSCLSALRLADMDIWAAEVKQEGLEAVFFSLLRKRRN